jgi:hypothetical protein
MEEANTVYKATLEITSTADPDGSNRIAWHWDPPMAKVLDDTGGTVEGLPGAYRLMGSILDQAVLPIFKMNERYEAELNVGNSIKEAFNAVG